MLAGVEGKKLFWNLQEDAGLPLSMKGYHLGKQKAMNLVKNYIWMIDGNEIRLGNLQPQ